MKAKRDLEVKKPQIDLLNLEKMSTPAIASISGGTYCSCRTMAGGLLEFTIDNLLKFEPQ